MTKSQNGAGAVLLLLTAARATAETLITRIAHDLSGSGHNYIEICGSNIACASFIANLRQTWSGVLVFGVGSRHTCMFSNNLLFCILDVMLAHVRSSGRRRSQTCINKQAGMSCGLPRAPSASMIRLTHSSWITVKGVSPLVRADTKAMTSATKLTVSWNCSSSTRQ